MKIISNEKDYYDYLSHIYGIDPKIVYKRKFSRKPLNEKELLIKSRPIDFYGYIKYRNSTYANTLKRLYGENLSYIIISICGNLHVVRDVKGLKEDQPFDSTYTLLNDEELDMFSKSNYFGNNLYYYLNSNYDKNYWIDLHKKLQEPILFIEYINHEKIILTDNILLKNIKGLAEKYPPELIYQQISQFISYHFNTNEPPLELNDKEKIIKSGFDLKKSFRHRK
jgi:hypothetical protein